MRSALELLRELRACHTVIQETEIQKPELLLKTLIILKTETAVMSIAALLIALRARRVRLDTDGDALRVSAPAGELTLEIADAIAFHEPRLLTLPRPYITDTGELAIPCSAAPQYHWQPMAETLRELGASRVVWERYTSAPFIVVQ